MIKTLDKGMMKEESRADLPVTLLMPALFLPLL